MGNFYATVQDGRGILPARLYDEHGYADESVYRSIDMASRLVDRCCRRFFFPRLDTYYFNGGKVELLVPDLIAATTVSYSDDDGVTYTDLTAADYYLTVGGDFNRTKSYSLIVLNVDGDLAVFPSGQRAVRVVGVWGYADDRTLAFEDSLDTVEDNPLTAGGISITVNDADGADEVGHEPRFGIGSILRIGDEYLNVSDIDYHANLLTVVRGKNGSTAASHVQNTQIDLWRPPSVIQQATILIAAKLMERNSEASKKGRNVGDFDSVIQMLLAPYIQIAVG